MVFGPGVRYGRQIVLLTILEQRIADRIGIADETDSAGTGIMNVTTRYQHTTVVVVHKDSIAAHLVELAIQDADILGAGQHKGAAAINRPVRA